MSLMPYFMVSPSIQVTSVSLNWSFLYFSSDFVFDAGGSLTVQLLCTQRRKRCVWLQLGNVPKTKSNRFSGGPLSKMV